MLTSPLIFLVGEKMSDHHVEDAVEALVRAVAESDVVDKRSAIAALFQFQRRFDCSDTLLRVGDVLMRERYLYALPESELPTAEDWSTCVQVKGHVFIEAGSEPWARACAAGLLPAEEHVAPQTVNLATLVTRFTAEDFDLQDLWQALMPEVRKMTSGA
ncbi:MAG: hypothetical protein ACI9KE_005485 [Polyangiales bacterium]|jgi:hypothetical protein